MKSAALAFSGMIASGKTSISLSTAHFFSWKYASFGKYIRKVALQRNIINPSRDIMQEIGLSLIDMGWDNFCRLVISESNWVEGQGLVIDGVRHIECLQSLRRILAPMDVLSIYVTINQETQKERVKLRGDDPNQLPLLAKHSTEIQVTGILNATADFYLSGNEQIDINIGLIRSWLQKKDSLTKT